MRLLSLVAVMALSTLFCTPQLEAGFWNNIKSFVAKQQPPPPPSIDILIVNDQPSIDLEVKGTYILFDPHTKKALGKRYVGKKRPIQPLSSGIKWGEEFPGIFQLQIQPEDGNVHYLVNGHRYKGALFIYDIGGSLSVVNRLSIEEFLASTLHDDFVATLPQETAAAYLIAMRTNAYYRAVHPQNHFWSVEAEAVGYNGNVKSSIDNHFEKVLQSTRHMILSQAHVSDEAAMPFLLEWSEEAEPHNKAEVAQLTIQESVEMGEEGKHAAQILKKAFPNSHIELIY